MEANLDKEQMEDVILNDDRGNNWGVVFENNNGRIYDNESLIRTNRLYI